MADDSRIKALRDALDIVRARAVPFAILGSIAASRYRAAEWPGNGEDIDFFLEPGDAPGVLDAFDREGWETERTFPEWLYKAKRDGVVVDLIFCVMGSVRLDDEMVSRAHTRELGGMTLPILAPEDLIVTEVVAHGPETGSLWFNALDILENVALDWPYFERRVAPHRARALALLAYARSNGIAVDDQVAARLAADVFGERV